MSNRNKRSDARNEHWVALLTAAERYLLEHPEINEVSANVHNATVQHLLREISYLRYVMNERTAILEIQ